MNSMKDKNVLVLGLGMSGQSAVRFLLKRGAHVSAVDDDQEKLCADSRIASLKGSGLTIIENASVWSCHGPMDLVVASPGISPSHPYYKEALKRGVEVIGEVELGCRAITHRCAAITGTNGKTTVTLLTAHILNYAGKMARALGNVGKPLTQAIDEIGESTDTDEIFVVELSSFQLETLRSTFADVGIILNITPDHLDRYRSMEAYAQAKINLGRNIKLSGKLFANHAIMGQFRQLLEKYRPRSYGYAIEADLSTDSKSVWLDGHIAFTVPIPLYGRPSIDLENMLAAYALCKEFGVSEQQFVEGFASFQKPPHRIQFIRNVNGVSYYDDSKGTNIDAVIKAVECMTGDVVLIAGGLDKGAAYTPWAKAFAGKVKLICAIGQAAKKIKNELDSDICIRIFSNLEESVKYAAKHAPTNSNVLLSPGCSSYDMFTDYMHRGREFQRIVQAL